MFQEEESGEVSEDSSGYINEVHKILGADAISSRRHEDLFMARCDHLGNVKNLINSKPTNTHLSDLLEHGAACKLKECIELDNKSEKELDMEKLENPSDKLKALRQERRSSERVIQNMNLSTSCSSRILSNKRTLEGNNDSSNSFSILGNDEIIDRSMSMGVKLDVSSFASIDILKNMENARIALSKKQIHPAPAHISNDSSFNDSEVLNLELDSKPDCVNSDNDVESDLEDFTLVTSKIKRKPNNRFMPSGRKPPQSKSKKISCSSSHQSTKNKESPCGAGRVQKSKNKES